VKVPGFEASAQQMAQVFNESSQIFNQFMGKANEEIATFLSNATKEIQITQQATADFDNLILLASIFLSLCVFILATKYIIYPLLKKANNYILQPILRNYLGLAQLLYVIIFTATISIRVRHMTLYDFQQFGITFFYI